MRYVRESVLCHRLTESSISSRTAVAPGPTGAAPHAVRSTTTRTARTRRFYALASPPTARILRGRMPSPPLPGFFSRIAIAFSAYFAILFDAALAAKVSALRSGAPALPAETEKDEKPKKAPKEKKAPAPVMREAGPEAALQLLALLQREGRFVDFLEEDLASLPDAQIGAAARVVHEKCRAAIREHFPLEPVRAEEEGSKVTLEKGFDAQKVRVVGNVVGEPPFTGSLVHRGWRVREVKLPKMAEGHDATIVASAEVEL